MGARRCEPLQVFFFLFLVRANPIQSIENVSWLFVSTPRTVAHDVMRSWQSFIYKIYEMKKQWKSIGGR
jgi:hypothetical protein